MPADNDLEPRPPTGGGTTKLYFASAALFAFIVYLFLVGLNIIE